jgi:hypothetical protein
MTCPLSGIWDVPDERHPGDEIQIVHRLLFGTLLTMTVSDLALGFQNGEDDLAMRPWKDEAPFLKVNKNTNRRWRPKTKKPCLQAWLSFLKKINPATSYSPTRQPVQYHRHRRA